MVLIFFFKVCQVLFFVEDEKGKMNNEIDGNGS